MSAQVSAWRGPWTLFVKEVRRFLRVPGQTVFSPAITASLYLVVFGWALGNRLRDVDGIPYFAYITPGLVMLSVISNAFLNSASSMMGMKIMGTLVDLLVTPLSYGQVVSAMVGAAVVRALIVGVLTFAVAVVAQGGFHVAHAGYTLVFVVAAAVALGALGLLTGIWADKFEQLNAVPTFVITPLTFLGGVFYDVRNLPPVFATLSQMNPVLYLVDGLRWGLVGRSAVDPGVALGGLLVFDALAVGACLLVLRAGWKLRT